MAFPIPDIRQVGFDLRKICITFAIALAAGFICFQLRLPAPFMIGSLFGVWIVGGLIKPLQPHLGVARWLHKPVVILLATLIGGTFTTDVLSQALAYVPTLIAMVVASVLATLIGLGYMILIRGHQPRMALLCCLPGGQADILAIAHEVTDKDYVVALCHLARVVIVFLATPAILAFYSGSAGVAGSYEVQAALPTLMDMNLRLLIEFVGTGIAGYLIARLLRLPMPHLLGPLLFSALLHVFGFIQIPRLSEFVILAQLAIAGNIGARLARVPIREIASYLPDAIANAVLIVATFIFMAFCINLTIGLDLIELVLAFVPGGLYEVTLLALIFGYDVAFVSFHHTVRLLMIFLFMPFLIAKVQPKKNA